MTERAGTEKLFDTPTVSANSMPFSGFTNATLMAALIATTAITMSPAHGQYWTTPYAGNPIEYTFHEHAAGEHATSAADCQSVQVPSSLSAGCSSCLCDFDLICQSLKESPTLTGDWRMFRPSLQESGITTDVQLTQFYQGVTSGGAEQIFRYGGKLDLFFDFDTAKMGLWKGGNLFIHAANWNYGQNSNADATFLAPVNANMLYPKGEPSFAVTSLWYQQALGDSGYALLAGRYDLLDVWALFYPEYGRGVDGFMNVSSFVPFNIVTIGLPPISNLAGIVKAGEQGIEAALLVLETANHPTNIGLNFPNGVTILPTLRKYTKFGGLRGTHTLAAWYATGDFTAFDVDGWIEYPPGVGVPPTQSGSWSATYLVEQRLWQDRCNEKRYTNFFGYIDWSDGDTNPFQFTGGCSLEAFGLFLNRPGDRMGIAGFYNALGDVSDLLSVVTPTGDVYGGEFYYNAEINAWFHLSFDLQAVRPGFRTRDVAIVSALRAKIDF